MVFGTPGTTGFVMFGFWASAIWDTAPEAVLVDARLEADRGRARAYEKLMAAWSTDVTVRWRPTARSNSPGSTATTPSRSAGKTFPFELVRGKTAYNLGAP